MIAPPRAFVIRWCSTRVESRTVITMYELEAAAATDTGAAQTHDPADVSG
jgi:hypothetical protein